MNVILTQFIILILLLFSSDSCRRVKVAAPADESNISNSNPPNSPIFPKEINSQPISPLSESWRISLKTGGGFDGGGTGNFAADSTGKFVYQKPRIRGETPPPCRASLSLQETDNLTALADDWRLPDADGQNKLKIAANDAFHFTIEISSGAATYKVEFYENSFENLPLPNQNLVKALFDLKEKLCGSH